MGSSVQHFGDNSTVVHEDQRKVTRRTAKSTCYFKAKSKAVLQVLLAS